MKLALARPFIPVSVYNSSDMHRGLFIPDSSAKVHTIEVATSRNVSNRRSVNVGSFQDFVSSNLNLL